MIIQVELPGVSASSIHVYGMGGALYVKGVKEADYPPPGEVLFHAFERRFGKFEVRVGIPCPVQLGSAKATYGDGIVRVELPKIEERRLRKRLVPLAVLECE